MARLPRYFFDHLPLHIVQRGNNRTSMWSSSQDRLFFRQCLGEAISAHGLALHAYVFMTNHVHLLATPTSPDTVPKVMQSVGRRYVQWYNRASGRTGTLWEGRYRATVVDTERYVLTCMRYIELNPVRAAICTSPDAYEWSSYGANALGADDPLITPHETYRNLGFTAATRLATYRGLFGQPILCEELTAIRDATNRAWVLGDRSFCGQVEAATGRRAAPLPRGRRSTVEGGRQAEPGPTRPVGPPAPM